MRGFFALKSLAYLLAAGTVSVSAAEPQVVDMWKCPMPKVNVKGAGYPEINKVVHTPIFKATMETGGYNHHAKIIRFKDKFYAMWSNHKFAEDGPGQKVYYSTSADGKKWAPHKILFASMHKEAPWGNSGINLSANKWIVQNGKLYARAWCGATLAWTDKRKTARSKKHTRKFCFAVRKRYDYLYRAVNPDGKLGPIATYRLKTIPKDVLVKVENARKVYPELKIKKPAIQHYRAMRMIKRRLCEGSSYQVPDGSYVALFRDDNYSHRKWVSYSKDGINWTKPQPTNIPDSPSATTNLVLKDGTVLLIGNHMAPEFDKDKPRHYKRDPLMVSVSKDGKTFDKSYALRSGQQKYTVPRKVVRGRGGGAQYPDVILDGDTVYVIYSLGKEDIWVSSFNLKDIGAK